MPTATTKDSATEPAAESVSVPAAARRVGVSVWTIRRAAGDGGLAAFKVRGHWRIPVAALDALFAGAVKTSR